MKNIIIVLLGMVRAWGIKLFNFSSFKFEGVIKISPTASIEIVDGGKITIGDHSSLGRNSEIAAVGGGIVLEKHVHVGSNCIIISHEEIIIREGTILGPHVYIYDHDHKMDNQRVSRDKYSTVPIKIGKNVWIGTNTVILKGTKIGDNSIIGAGSVVSGTIPANVKVIQKRNNTILGE